MTDDDPLRPSLGICPITHKRCHRFVVICTRAGCQDYEARHPVRNVDVPKA